MLLLGEEYPGNLTEGFFLTADCGEQYNAIKSMQKWVTLLYEYCESRMLAGVDNLVAVLGVVCRRHPRHSVVDPGSSCRRDQVL